MPCVMIYQSYPLRAGQWGKGLAREEWGGGIVDILGWAIQGFDHSIEGVSCSFVMWGEDKDPAPASLGAGLDFPPRFQMRGVNLPTGTSQLSLTEI